MIIIIIRYIIKHYKISLFIEFTSKFIRDLSEEFIIKNLNYFTMSYFVYYIIIKVIDFKMNIFIIITHLYFHLIYNLIYKK